MGESDSTARLAARVTGRVQGVAFRWYTVRVATQLGLTGWVCNRLDGSVELLAEGDRRQLEQLLEWCQHGPSMAKVAHVEANWEEATGEFFTFDIRH